MNKKHMQKQDGREVSDDVRIVLLGKTGAGKSAAVNTILGRKTFMTDISHESVTKECQRERTEVNSRYVTVIDTPGLFNTELSHEEIQTEMINCLSMSLPGPHVFIIVLSLAQRFTKEDTESLKIIQETFGENSLMYTMVLFTRGDDLKDKTIEEFLGEPGSPLMDLIEQCGNRYHIFNNTETEDRRQVSSLLEKIDALVKENRGSYYSSKIFRQMEREKQEKQIKILMERIEQLSKEKEEEIEKIEKQSHVQEKKKMEELFSKNEKQFREKIEEIENRKTQLQEQLMRKLEEAQKRMHDDERKREEDKQNWREKQEMVEKLILNEQRLREEQCKNYEEKIQLTKQQCQDELMRVKPDDYEHNRRRDIENIKLCCSQTTSCLQVSDQ
ncbi:GTPase IMAP family member 9-like [Triplophysa dalaica]|uniref:GTPase IMAP family member 9-like n=1 Tax=Triplophysa dalaica TaxID=1582913 RepID=UPI0024DF96D8|nr:GTPase IMAP family member 9-like [Triplophysa dalaica]